MKSADRSIIRTNVRRAVLTASIFGCCGRACAQAQASAIAVPETIKLSRLVDLMSQTTGRQVSYNPADLEATVTLRSPLPLSVDQLRDLTAQVLASRGLTTVQAPGSPVLSVVKIEQAAATSQIGEVSGAAFVSVVIPVTSQPAKVVADVIRPLLSKPGGAVTVLGDTSLLLVSDLAARLGDIRAIIQRVDVPEGVVSSEVRLQHVGAAQALSLVGQLAAKREAAGARKLAGDLAILPDGVTLMVISPREAEQAWRDLIGQVDRREGVESVTYTPRYFSAKETAKLVESVVTAPGAQADERFKVIVDELTGSLIVTGTASQHERVTALLTRLESNEHGPTSFRSFPVRNRPVNEVLQTLRQLVAAGVLETDRDSGRAEITAGASQTNTRSPLMPQAQPSVPAATQNSAGQDAARPRPSLLLTADESTNTLIALAEPRVLGQVEGLLAKLDVRQPQVMLEVTLVSLSDTDAITLGTELERLGSLGNATVRLSSLFGLSSGPAPSRNVGDAPGFTGAVLNPGEYSVIVRAFESLNKGRALSNPKLLVSNNERAVFSSTVQEPVQSLTRTGSNDSTFSYGGTENAGTTISVKPQIAQGDHLVLTYSIKLSSFVGSSATPGLPPPKQENAVDSVATIPDGHTVVVGGLDLVNDSKAESRIPFIGAIPGIGELFKTRNNANSRTRFFVFIKATVLRSGTFEDLKYISDVEAQNARVNDGFPEVQARVIR
jgi:general secretion pathway protein D